MKGSWKLGQFAGIGVYVHWTFLILIGFIVFANLDRGGPAIAMSVAFVLSVFACVVLHEFGHALTARRYGIHTRDITLLPIGGVARLERMPEEPLQELWVALAGPAVNVVIAAILAVVVGALGQLDRVTQDLTAPGTQFLAHLLIVNLWLVLFNLVPAFPMDGGRVLRAILAWSHGDYVRATQTAAMIGQGLAIAFGIWGLFQMNPFVIFIALFVYLGAQEEAYAAQMRSVFRGLPVREAMLTRFRVLSPHDTLGKAVDELLAGSQQDFPVVDNGAVVGVLLRSKLFKALTEQGRDVPVSQAMQSGCAAVSDSDMLQTTFERMRSEQCPCLPVLRNGQLVGMVTLENVGELMFIRSALGVDGARGVVEDIYRG